jgi:hypothetical protein
VSVIPVLFVILMALVVVVQVWSSGEGTEASRVKKAQAQLSPCLGFPGLEDGRLEGERLQGSFAGHAVNLSVGSRRVGDATVQTLRYALELPGRAYSQSLPSAKDLGDSLAEGGAQAEGVQRALAHLGKIPGLELRVSAGWLVIERLTSGYAKGKTSLSSTFRAMSQLAPFLTRTTFLAATSAASSASAQIKVQARDAASASEEDVNLAWTERKGGEPLCPYCRDDLGAAGLELSRCVTCHTVHHSECLEELGHCAIFGCKGKRPEPLRA